MPGIRLLGRRWEISSDDFVFPGITEGISRFAWWIILLSVYATNVGITCGDTKHLHVFVIMCLVTNALSGLLAVSIAVVSSRGTLRNSTPRRPVVILIYCRMLLGIYELIWLFVGSAYTKDAPFWFQPQNSTTINDSGASEDCFDPVAVAAKWTVILGWLLFCLCIVGFWTIFDPLGHLHHTDRVNMTDQSKLLWRKRLNWFGCCFIGNDDNATNAYESVAEIIVSFFVGVDVVISDIWAGVLLLSQRESAELLMQSTDVEPLNLGEADDRPPDWMNLKLASRFMEFSLGVYGWPYYVCDQMSVRSVWTLWRELRCGNQCRCHGNVFVIRDNCCWCNTAALRLQTGIAEADLFYASFRNAVYEVPFVAAIDHRSQSVVISIRGSMSLRDALTDLCVNEEPLDVGGEASLVYMHKGMLVSARNLYAKLMDEKILFDLFVLQPDYDLVITGHSLGAGVASILTLLLQPHYPRVRCFAFSPPGCVVSSTGLPKLRDSVMSVILNDDMISRASICSINKLKSKVLREITHCDRPKHEILITGCYRLLLKQRKAASRTRSSDSLRVPILIEDGNADTTSSGGSSGDFHNHAPLLPPHRSLSNQYLSLNGDSGASGSFESAADSTTVTVDPRSQLCQTRALLYVPGRIVHLVSDDLLSSTYKAKWASPDEFRELKLSSGMVFDHLPYNVAAALRKVDIQNIV